MKLILRDYLASLKEEGELDVIISDLLFSKRIIPLSKSKKGVRQFGVDIIAKGKDDEGIQKLFIITAKRGDINRKVWDSGIQAVRPSLNEILDVYLPNLPKNLAALPCKIILATNGVMLQDVEPNWNGYINKHSVTNKIEFSFWDINHLAIEVENHLLNEYLFQNDLKVLLQKTLSLIEVNDYDLHHYYTLIDQVLFSQKIKNQNDIIKRLRLLKLCQAIVLKWGIDSDNLKNVYVSSERLVLKVTDFFRKNEFFGKKKLERELLSILSIRLDINIAYFNKIKSHCYVENAFSIYAGGGEIEYPLLVFDQMGIIAQIGLECLTISKVFSSNQEMQERYLEHSLECTEALWQLIENNPAAYYVLYDDHVIDISLMLLLFFQNHGYKAGETYINGLINRMSHTFNLKGFFPLFVKNYDSLLDIHLGHKENAIDSSHLFAELVEWSLAFGSIGNYDFIRSVISKQFPKLSLQIWFPDKDTEDTYYAKNAMHESGNTLVDIQLPEDYREYINRVQGEYENYNEEKDFYLSSKINFIPLLAARHFRNLIFPTYRRSQIVKPTVPSFQK